MTTDETTKVDGGGLRHNSGKAALHLNSGYLDFYLARVTEAGMHKYPKDNWRRGMNWSILVDCIGRHYNKLRNGQFYDEDTINEQTGEVEYGTGLPHLAIIAWNVMAWATYAHTFPEGNDLYTLPGSASFEEGTLRHGTYLLPDLFDREPSKPDSAEPDLVIDCFYDGDATTEDPFFDNTPFTAEAEDWLHTHARQRETPPEPGTTFPKPGTPRTLGEWLRARDA